MGECKEDGCVKPVHGHGWCGTHYARNRRRGTLPAKPKTLEEQLISNREIDENRCWLWTAGKTTKGYGKTKGTSGTPRLVAHIAAFKCWVGEVPKGKLVLHKCDVRLCFNPHHLYLGTNQDNTNDMLERGREQRGEDRWNAKLTEEDVKEIRRLIGQHSQKEISLMFGVSYGTIWDIINFQTWKHV